MALTKQPVDVNFAQGLDTKTDAYQVSVGKFLNLNNMVFDKAGKLTKRNGFANVTNIPNTQQTNLTTLNDNLIATGSNLYAYNAPNNQWLNRGNVQPIGLSVQPVVRTSTSQNSPDIAVAATGLACVVYQDSNGLSYYEIVDSATGQQTVNRTALPSSATNPRTTVFGNYFVVSYGWNNGGTPNISILAISINNPTILATVQVTSQFSAPGDAYDMIEFQSHLYFSWNGSDGTVKLRYIDTSFHLGSITSIAAQQATIISLTADSATQAVWLSFYQTAALTAFAAAYTPTLGTTLLPITALPTADLYFVAMTSAVKNGILNVFLDVNNNYSGVQMNYITTLTLTLAGVVTAQTTVCRSIGLASKAFMGPNNTIYMLAAYGTTPSPTNSNQCTYFLIDATGHIYMRLAYANGGGFVNNQILSSVNLYNGTYLVAYLFQDFLTTVNKGTANATGTPSNAIYTQTGVNLATITINSTTQYSSEIAGALHLTGGQLWEYDGAKPVEHGFHVYPENLTATWEITGGSMAAQPSGWVSGIPSYFYQICYEWTDAAGNLHRSAPSIPLPVVTTGSSNTNQVLLGVPALRLTDKTGDNPVRIVVYRWSVAQQVYYQVTSVANPIINNPNVDYIVFADGLSDAEILGNAILYTTGGVVENTAAPASNASALFKNRLVLVDAENPNLLWYSKQVIEAVPVEMSDLLTIYVAPTSGAQGSTGPITALSAMDDKLIIFKKDAIYYITGNGPDNTGANNDFSDPIYITSAVGCANPNSIVLMPNGLMFQSDKGIWILGRDLQTSYIGAPVEVYNSQTIMAATAIPATNQVRFILESNTTLIFDYFYSQWGTFSNTRGIAATLWKGAHTYLSALGQIFQETPGTYVDGSTPVLVSFTTSWLNVAGVRGYERFYYMLMLGTYFTPFKLNINLAYDYQVGQSQSILVSPDNYTPTFGSDPVFGSEAYYAGPGNVFQARIFPKIQKCQTFQVSISEVYDSTLGVAPGQGLSLSGMKMVVGVKKGYSPQRASKSFG